MDILQMIIKACADIIDHEINLFGYDISIMQVIAFGVLIVVVVRFVKLFI